jgi:hypothetical protein
MRKFDLEIAATRNRVIAALDGALPATVTINADEPVALPSWAVIEALDLLRGDV